MQKSLKATLGVLIVSSLSLVMFMTHTGHKGSGVYKPSLLSQDLFADSGNMNHTLEKFHPEESYLHNSNSPQIAEWGIKSTMLSHNPSVFYKPKLFWVLMHRLGNQLFEYSSAYCLAVTTDHTPTIPASSVLTQIFSNITSDDAVHRFDFHTARQYQTYRGAKLRERYCCKYDEETVEWVRSHQREVLIIGYRESYKYFLPCWQQLKQQLTLHDHIKKKAFIHTVRLIQDHFREKRSRQDFMAFSRLEEKWELGLPRSYTYIGVHVRRTDKKGMYAPLSFFDKAILHYVRRYAKPVFVVCSDDIAWCKQHMATRYWFADLVFISDSSVSPYVDFAVLVSCDHSIITSGTFGWWAAWLAGGEVIFYNSFLRAMNHFGWQYKQDDYYPPRWKPIF